MRPGEFWEALAAYRENQSDERRHIAELARGVAMILFNVQVSKKDRISKPSQFWSMPWDEKVDDAESTEIHRLTHLTDEEKEAEVQKFLSRINNGQRTKHEG